MKHSSSPMPASPSMHMGFDVLDQLQTPIAILDESAHLRFINAAFENSLGISRRFALGQAFTDFFPDPQGFQQALATQRNGLSSLRLDLGDFRMVLHGNTGQTIVECTPLTLLAQHERDARFATQALENKELIRNLAHEIKNPLGGIRGAAQLLQRATEERQPQTAPDKEQWHLSSIVIRECDRLQTLVDRLLEPHRSPKQVSDVNMHQVLEQVRQVLLAEYPTGLSVLRDYDVSLPELKGDYTQLVQALLNIAQNAAQAMHENIQNNTAQVQFKTRIARQATLGTRRCRLALEVRIIDNGPGIDPSIAERIFYPLVSGRDGGSGLGLTLAQTIVQNHSGLLSCESQAGHTEFILLLPLEGA